MGTREPKVDAYIGRMQPFAQEILSHLREVVHAACPDTIEAMKWSMPFFTYKGQLLCNMAGFKAHASFGFWLGAQVMGAEAVGDGMGHFGKLTSVKDLPSTTVLTRHIRKAMALVDAGVKLERGPGAATAGRPRQVAGGQGDATASTKRVTTRVTTRVAKRAAVSVPPELARALQRHPEAKAAFDAFAPSHRREYAEWIAEAKRPDTKERRVQQALEMLAEGKSRNWKYETSS